MEKERLWQSSMPIPSSSKPNTPGTIWNPHSSSSVLLWSPPGDVREWLAQRNAPGMFWAYCMSSIGAFHALIMADLPDRFQTLRMIFVEIASQWVPWPLKDLVRRLLQQRGRQCPENPLQ